MIIFDVSLAAHEGEEEAFVALLRRTSGACGQEPGCLRYVFGRDLEAVRAFYLLEMWQDEPALQAHAAGEPFRSFLRELPALGSITRSRAWTGDLAPYQFARPAL